MGLVDKRNFLKAFLLTFFSASFARAKSLSAFVGNNLSDELVSEIPPKSPVTNDFYANILRELEKNKTPGASTNMFIHEDNEFLAVAGCPEMCFKGKGTDCWGPPDCKIK